MSCCRRKSSFCPSFHQLTRGLGEPLASQGSEAGLWAVRVRLEGPGAMVGGSGERLVIRRQARDGGHGGFLRLCPEEELRLETLTARVNPSQELRDGVLPGED